jgi:Cu(I)/Ag(I) efflux system membrane fusion protein
MVVKVIELRLRFIALMAATGLVFGHWETLWNAYEKWSRPPGTHRSALAGSDNEFYCPMDPSVVRDASGSCPLCGMPLSKRKKGDKEPLPEGVLARVPLTPMRVKQAGIRTALIGYTALAETVKTVGYVQYDERRLARIASRTKGMARVEALHVNFTGTPVAMGQSLAELYSPELYQAIQELLLAQRSARDAPQLQTAQGRSILGDPQELTRLAVEKLKLWGLTAAQVDSILARGKTKTRVAILSPIGGVVVKKNIVEGQYVAEGEPMFEIADLRHVWVQAQVYEDQFAVVKVGQSVEASVEAYPGEVFSGTVGFIDPAFDPTTRTVNVRYDLENPDLRLRPGMFARVTLKTPVADTPAFRARARARTAAARTAEGKVRLLGRGPAEQEVCPVTNARLGSMGEPIPVMVQGVKVWICCAGCEARLRGQPERYLARLAPAATPEEGVLTVPESAVIDTGAHKVVYVESEPGVFEGRAVVLGPRSGDRYPVLDGLAPGERVAAAGAFLIDAETRLNPAAGAAYFGGSTPPRTASALDEPLRRK